MLQAPRYLNPALMALQLRSETKSRFSARMKQEISQLQGIHCFLCCQALALNTLPPKLSKFLDVSLKTINWVRSCALHHHLL